MLSHSVPGTLMHAAEGAKGEISLFQQARRLTARGLPDRATALAKLLFHVKHQ